MTLAEIEKERSQITSEIAGQRTAFDEAVRVSNLRLGVLAEAEQIILAGIDQERIERGRAVIDIRGRLLGHRVGERGDGRGARMTALADARKDVALGAPRLKSEYVGIKNYDGFGDQRSDHRYGYGPRHGSIVFSIGLNREIVRSGASLSPAQVEDALYLLANLAAIEAATAGKAAA